MTERPVLFSGSMVAAILAGRKSMTRRVMHPQPALPVVPRESVLSGEILWCHPAPGDHTGILVKSYRCPYGKPGDTLWCRETWAQVPRTAYHHDPSIPHRVSPDGHSWAVYREGWERCQPCQWKPSIHMFRWASRLTLELVSVRVERLRDISEEDVAAEGIQAFTKDGKVFKYWPCDPHDGPLKCAWADLPRDPREAFRHLWDRINGKKPGRSWADNPWVWTVSFRKVDE